jgi:hypothetical protein
MPGSASERQAARVKRYYRWLDGLDFFRGKRAEGEAAHPVHRALADPDGGPPSPMVIHRLMLEGVALPVGLPGRSMPAAAMAPQCWTSPRSWAATGPG